MIVAKIIGGLGNQMFQYSMARRAAYVNNTDLKLDISAYGNYKLREYKLNNFDINGDIATESDIRKFKGECNEKLVRIRNFLNVKIRRSYIKEQYYQFDKSILNIPKNAYVEGYWQSEKYFKDIGEIIRNDFKLKNKPALKNQELLDKIINCNSISIHIRRGDYVSNPSANKYHGILPLSYYKEAIGHIMGRVNDPIFFIFSDDIGWAKEHIKLNDPVAFISNGEKRDFEDLWLMSQCKHHVIANSSFSWWGAWLSNNPNKIVYAPMKWFRIERNTDDLIPKNWVKV